MAEQNRTPHTRTASYLAEPLTTLQVVEAMGSSPGVADPFKAKVVTSPSMHRVWFGPALALGPTLSVY